MKVRWSPFRDNKEHMFSIVIAYYNNVAIQFGRPCDWLSMGRRNQQLLIECLDKDQINDWNILMLIMLITHALRFPLAILNILGTIALAFYGFQCDCCE